LHRFIITLWILTCQGFYDKKAGYDPEILSNHIGRGIIYFNCEKIQINERFMQKLRYW